MKKKSIVLIIFLILVSILCTLTGCGNSNKTGLETKNDVENYLKEKYPNEQFEISDREEIDITYFVGEKEKRVKGFSYKVKSKTTNIEFTVKNDYQYNSIRHVYSIEDNYKSLQ